MAKSWLNRFLIWRIKHIQQKHFVLFLSLVVGLLSGAAAVIIKNSVHFIQKLVTKGFSQDLHNYLYFVFPLVGLLLTVLIIKYLIRRQVGHGIPGVLYAISKKNSIIKSFSLYASVVTSALTVGFGGSVGLEGPTVSTSGAIGSNVGRFLKLDYKTITLLIGCGAAGAMSGIFNAPIAALVFALEVFMFDLSIASIIPFLMASVSAAITSRMMLGDNVLFDIQIRDPFLAGDVPFYILLGVFTGLISVYFNKMFWFIEDAFARFKNPFIRLLIGGSLLGVLIFFIPPLYGEGFQTIKMLFSGNYSSIVNNSMFYGQKDNVLLMIGLIFILMFFKVIASGLTFGAGGVGGVFAPSLFVGATGGFVFAKSINFFGWSSISESNFTLVGMGGLIAGVLHAPLTALFLIAEITSGYELIIPLMITAAIAYLTSKYFVPHSIYNMQLAKRGELITRDKDKTVLTQMDLHTQIEKDFNTVHINANLGDLVQIIAQSSRNLFPVVDDAGSFQGMIELNDIREIMFNAEMYDEVKVSSLMVEPQDLISLKDNMDVVVDKFTKTNAWNLPVVEEGKYVGFVSKSKLFTAYRNHLKETTLEE
ncbi:MAG: chloride channel protein [Flavobacteriales bacterium]|nr:chloride channel protein [Flavobacteriales bacterium]